LHVLQRAAVLGRSAQLKQFTAFSRGGGTRRRSAARRDRRGRSGMAPNIRTARRVKRQTPREAFSMTTTKSSRKSIPDKNDAIALLKADHRDVEEAFEHFKKARDPDRRQEIATQICNALRVHTTIEEEIFYPAFLAATGDTDVHHEAEVEHSGAKK